MLRADVQAGIAHLEVRAPRGSSQEPLQASRLGQVRWLLDSTRLQTLEALRSNPGSLQELAARLGRVVEAVEQDLAGLRELGLVRYPIGRRRRLSDLPRVVGADEITVRVELRPGGAGGGEA